MAKSDNELTATAERLLKYRKNLHLSQKELAEKIGASEAAYRRWETGRGLPETQSLIALADVFNVSTDYILGLSNVYHVGNKEVEEITGLSQTSIETLRELRGSEHRGSGQMALAAVNTLLEDETHGFSALRFIGEYIRGRFNYFSMPGSGIYQPNILMTEYPADGMGSASLIDIKRVSAAATMTLIQDCLFELRKKFQREKD